jgi:hypothetical protein
MNKGAHLTSILSEEEQDFITKQNKWLTGWIGLIKINNGSPSVLPSGKQYHEATWSQ